MKINLIFGLIVLAVLLLLLGFNFLTPETMTINNYPPSDLKLVLKGLTPTGMIMPIYTCDGKNFSPPLIIDGVPVTAQSLALTVIDPDAPSGQFVHWLMWNIDPKTTNILEDILPMGVTVGTGSAGRVGYVGPCPPRREAGPPTGTHHYVFKLLVLDTKLSLPVSTTLTEFKAAAASHIVAETEIVATYNRAFK